MARDEPFSVSSPAELLAMLGENVEAQRRKLSAVLGMAVNCASREVANVSCLGIPVTFKVSSGIAGNADSPSAAIRSLRDYRVCWRLRGLYSPRKRQHIP